MIIITNYAKRLLRKLESDKSVNEIYAVYGHYNKLNNKWYCGQTKYYKELWKRWHSGHGYLGKRNGQYLHPKFAPAIIKYGWDNFEHIILGYYTVDKVDNAEKYWIKQKNSFNDGYNSNTGGQKTKVFSKETRDRMSIANKKRNLSGSNNPMYGKPGTRLGVIMNDETKKKISDSLRKSPKLTNCIRRGSENSCSLKVVAISIETGDFLKIFDCVDDAGRVFGASNGASISACCKGKRFSAYGFKWCYYENLSDKSSVQNMSIDEMLKMKVTGRPGSVGKRKAPYKKHKQKIKIEYFTAYKKDDPEWSMNFNNRVDAEKVLGCPKQKILDILNNRRKSYKGYTFKYTENN